jgi:hypothetical protein
LPPKSAKGRDRPKPAETKQEVRHQHARDEERSEPEHGSLHQAQEQRVERAASWKDLLGHVLEACPGSDHLCDVGALPCRSQGMGKDGGFLC